MDSRIRGNDKLKAGMTNVKATIISKSMTSYIVLLNSQLTLLTSQLYGVILLTKLDELLSTISASVASTE